MALPEVASPGQPVHKSVQRLRWFVAAFENHVALTGEETGCRYALDEVLLIEAFAGWLRAHQHQNPSREVDKPAYVGFAAGLMLRELIRRNPARCTAVPDGADGAKPEYYWPEGYLYVHFCLTGRGLVLEKDYDGWQQPSPILNDIRTWWSFRENVADDPSAAIGFLDLFAGDTPDFEMPALFRPERFQSERLRALGERSTHRWLE